MVDAETLTALVGQVGTLVLDHSGNVLSSTGQLTGAAGENAAKTVLATLQDTKNVLDTDNKEVLQRLVVNFSTFDYVVTLDNAQVYIVKRTKSPPSE
ncbi:hypothetical protein Poli38472_001180 [Pythium oligandrum]|uniref:Late endosomal/lysosomal adaptor and MAPK and MTOR activator 4 n=1 Tax=Pythium oligandrum TaxID=41045 RepID=A0A8K1CT09_PYTOL|nr:hypothetical protein Poli38472_001180 [Pythium oligandrum]|eukprot:TMW69024.1 hypothetical protein Poli38472_001180 [Pythium oligandrum]